MEKKHCGEKALEYMAKELGIVLEADAGLLGELYNGGSYIAGRCSILQAAYFLNGIMCGRIEPWENREFLRNSSLAIHETFLKEMESIECSELCGKDNDENCPVWEKAMACAGNTLRDIKEKMMKKKDLMKKFKVHERMAPYIDYLMTEKDWRLVASADENGVIPTNQFDKETLERAYVLGILNKEKKEDENIYLLGTCHRHIECFMRSHLEEFNNLPKEVRENIVDYEQDINLWVIPYREEGVNKGVVTPVPIERALEIVNESNCRFWVQKCDCKIYRYDKKHMKETCIHFMAEDKVLNSNFDRGYARELTKKETKELLIEIDKDGLVHNFAGDSFCNCCDCCCWALRGMETYRELGYDVFGEYVNAQYIISINEDKCKGCGACMEICPGKALELVDKKIKMIDDRCLGCGVCRTKCAFDVLKIVKR